MSARPAASQEDAPIAKAKASGQYRTFAKQRQRCFPWPARDRKAAFDRWYKLAGAVLRHHKLKLAFFQSCRAHVDWPTGEIWVTSAKAAAEAGGWSTKTIDRNIRTMVDIGLFIMKLDRRQNEDGVWQTLRGLRLSLPENMPAGVDVGDRWMDYCSPPDDDLWMDYCSPLLLVDETDTFPAVETSSRRHRSGNRR